MKPTFSLVATSAILLAIFASTSSWAQTREGKGTFTLYYLAEVTPRAEGGGGSRLRFADSGGNFQRFRLSPGDLKKANARGTAFARRPDGSIIVGRMVSPDLWTDLPAGWYGTGNKANPLVPYRIVSADQRHHPFGSRVFVPGAVGMKSPDGKTLDGYFWVGDIGDGIRGPFRFDVFVGLEPVYREIMKTTDGHWVSQVKVEAPPKPRIGLDYRNEPGRRKILEKLGYDVSRKVQNLEGGSTGAEAALIDFQRQHPQIPKLEYGRGDSAVTRWFLAQAAEAVASGETYPVGPSGE